MKKFKQLILNVLPLFSLLLYTFILLFLIESFSRGGILITFQYIKGNFNTYIYNSLIILLTLLPFILLKKRIFYISFISIVWILLALVNNILLTLRGTPLTGSDFGMIKNAIELIPKYLSISSIIIISLLLLLLVVCFALMYIKINKSKVNYYITIPLIIGYIFIFPKITNYAESQNIVSRNFWDLCGQYSANGFPYSFLYSISNSGISKPDNYSKDTMTSINEFLENVIYNGDYYIQPVISSINESSSTLDSNSNNYPEIDMLPNIIFVQLESFIDPTWIEDIEYNEDPIPIFRQLCEEYSSGVIDVPTIGGGTANTEFEVVTGMPMDFFCAGEFPFNTLASKTTVPSFAYYLQNLNYDTHALHNYDCTYYSRYKAYKNLGFHTFTSIETMDISEVTPFNWPKDKVLINQIESSLNSSDTQDLIFAVSVQGHGGYANYYIDDLPIRAISSSSNYNINNIDYYINQLKEMDNFIGDLITMVESRNEHTMIIFYGDHLPSLGLKAEKLTTRSMTATPYVIWNNFGLSKENKDLEAYELSTEVITKLNYPSTALSTLYNSSLDEETKREYLNLLEYDLLYGESYLGEKLTPHENFRFGINTVSVDSIEFNENQIVIRGDNFNYYSQAYINNSEIKTICIDKNTLTIDKIDLNVGDIITVKQISASNSIELSTSNDLIITNEMLNNNTTFQ